MQRVDFKYLNRTNSQPVSKSQYGCSNHSLLSDISETKANIWGAILTALPRRPCPCYSHSWDWQTTWIQKKQRVFQMLLITLLFRSAPDTSLDDKLLKWNHDWLIKEIICHAKQFQNLCMHIFFILQRGKTAFFSSLNYDILDLFHM